MAPITFRGGSGPIDPSRGGPELPDDETLYGSGRDISGGESAGGPATGAISRLDIRPASGRREGWEADENVGAIGQSRGGLEVWRENGSNSRHGGLQAHNLSRSGEAMVEAVKAQARREMQMLEAELLGVISSMEEQVKTQTRPRAKRVLTLHSTLNTQHSTLHTQHSTPKTQHPTSKT